MDFKEIIKEALDNYRFQNGFASRKQAVEKLGYPVPTIQRYIAGTRVPQIEYFFDLLVKTNAVEFGNGFIKINSKTFKKSKKGQSHK